MNLSAFPLSLTLSHQGRGERASNSGFRPAYAMNLNTLSGENPILSTTFEGENAACSISAKELSGSRFSSISPTSIGE